MLTKVCRGSKPRTTERKTNKTHKAMKTANIYRCTAGTRRDRVNLYYINCNAAHSIREKDNKTTEILNRYGNSIAVFVSE